MPRGGFRPGAGRPKGATAAAKKPAAKGKVSPKAKVGAAKAKKPAKAKDCVVVLSPPPPPRGTDQVVDGQFIPARRDPLEYMLDVMNDSDADDDLRARMAIAAAPYVHPKKGESGKKDARKDAAAGVAGGRFAPSVAPPLNPRRSH